MSRTLNKQLDQAQVFIGNVLGVPDLQAAFAEAGRDATYFADGQVLYERVRRLYHEQRAGYGSQYGATQSLHAVREAADRTYMRHLRLARIVFRGDARAAQTLKLKGTRTRTLADWLGQTAAFYDNLVADEGLLAGLTSLGVSEAELAEARAAVEAVAEASRRQKRDKGVAQQATQARDAALAELKMWLQENMALARVLLAEEPQRLEQLGLLARS